MSHFRCPNNTLVEEAGIYGYQPITGLDETQLYPEDDTHTVVKTNDPPRCWICFGEETDSEGHWIFPCQCSLVSHEQCLLDWITENQKNTNPLKRVSCPQCASPYFLTERHSIPLVLMSLVDSLAHGAAPYLTVMGLGFSMLITSTTYGVYAVLTMFGTEEGERLIGNPAGWGWRTWVGLPSIPVALVAARSRWADHVLPAATLLLLRLTGVSYPLKVTWPPSPAVVFGLLPWVRLIYTNVYKLIQRKLSNSLIPQQNTINQRRNDLSIEDTERGNNQDTEILFGREGRDMSVSLVGALLWPTVSGIVGSYLSHSKLVRRYFPETFHRNVLGGCLFVIAKDFVNLYYKYEKIKRRRSRRVVNYSDIKRRSK